jgi:hypothetical protein
MKNSKLPKIGSKYTSGGAFINSFPACKVNAKNILSNSIHGRLLDFQYAFRKGDILDYF